MSCTITFIVNNKPFIIKDVDETLLTEGAESAPSLKANDEDKLIARIIRAVKSKNQYKDLKKLIIELLGGKGAAEQANPLTFLQSQTGLVPNTDVNYLRALYPDVEFPEDVNIPILLVNRLGASEEFGVLSARIETTNGKDLYVVRNNRSSIMHLANWLKCVSFIEGKNSMIDNFEDDLNNELDELALHLDISKKELLKKYLNNASQYKDIKDFVSSLGRTASFILEEAINILKDAEGIQRYNKKEHHILNEFSKAIKAGKTPYVDLGKFIAYCLLVGFLSHIKRASDFAKVFDKNITDVDISKWNPESEFEKDFKEKFSQVIEAAKTLESEENGLYLFIETLFSMRDMTEPLFRYKFNKVGKVNGKVVLEMRKSLPSFKNVYGTTYETLKVALPVAYEGSWTIYEHKIKDDVVYIPTRHVLTENSEAITFATQEEAVLYARKLSLKETLRQGVLGTLKSTSRGEGRTFVTSSYLPVGSIVKSLDIKIDFDNMNNDDYLLLDGNLIDFLLYIDSLKLEHKLEILSKINTAEKAAAFLGILNSEGYKRDDAHMLEAAEKVEALGYKYYYIRKVGGTNNLLKNSKEHEYSYYFLPIPNTVIENKKFTPRMPIITILDEIAKEMREKFNVPIEILTASEIGLRQEDENDPLYNQEIMANTKAFICNGTIYVNSTEASGEDLFHEYAHLFLGVIKQRNPEWYVATLNKLLEVDKTAKAAIEKKMQILGRSYYDAAEEVFADKYGNYLMDRLPLKVASLFTGDVVKEAAHSIFDLKDGDFSLEEFLQGKKLSSLFTRFNSNVVKALKSGNEFLHDDALKMQRKKLNWIEKLLKLYKELKAKGISDDENEGIKEEC